MASLPASNDSLLVLSTTGRASEWQTLRDIVRTDTEDGFRAYVTFVDDEVCRGATAEELRDAMPARGSRAAILFAADERTLSEPGFPVLVIDLAEHRPPFRCIAAQLRAVENNLNIANMDWEEFADAVDGTGVYRGF